jgi:hypothetical protein
VGVQSKEIKDEDINKLDIFDRGFVKVNVCTPKQSN